MKQAQYPKDKPKIGIIGGRGRMGAYFADYFRRDGYTVLVSDSRTRLTNKELACRADVVIVSVPIHKTAEVIAEVVPFIKKEGVIMDLTSLKEFPVKEMLKAKSEVIGLHPLFSHTNPLPGQTVIACPARSHKWYPWIKEFLESNGARVIRLTPREHDKITAVVQSLVHFADIAFGNALKRIKFPVKDYLKYATPSSELKIAFAARLLAQDPSLYADIQIQNPYARKVIKEYAESIRELMEIGQKKDARRFGSYFKAAGRHLKNYQREAFDDTNYLIHAILERRMRAANQKDKKRKAKKAFKKTKPGSRHDLAVLGPKNTYSDLAAMEYLKETYDRADIYFASGIREIFNVITAGGAQKGLVPLENLINGSVRETYDGLYEENVHIAEKLNLEISHALVALNGVELSEIDTVSSHAQALEQCSSYLRKNLPQISMVASSSTAAAYEKMAGENDRHTAVIIPERIARHLNCNILATGIGDLKNNSTSFVLLKKGKAPDKIPAAILHKKENVNDAETFIAFHFHSDKPGALLKIFRYFFEAGINLNKIESRPSKKEPGNHIFYLSFECADSPSLRHKVLEKVRKSVAHLKILGIYPAGTGK